MTSMVSVTEPGLSSIFTLEVWPTRISRFWTDVANPGFGGGNRVGADRQELKAIKSVVCW